MPGGPYVQAALFCDRVLTEADGVVSAIRIVDQFTHHVTGPSPQVPTDMPPMLLQTNLFVALKAGDARGRYAVTISPEAPSGTRLPELRAPVNFTAGGTQGVNLMIPLQMQLVEEGLYWFDVLWVDDRASSEDLLTRVPLQLVYQPQPIQ